MHDSVFELAVACAECGLIFVAFFDSDKVIGVPEVQLGEYPSSARSVEHLRDKGEGVPVLDCRRIERPVVHA